MSEGIKIPIVINWSVLLGAALAVVLMYGDVQNLKKSQGAGVSPERIALLEGKLSAHEETAEAKAHAVETRLNDTIERLSRLERSRDWERRTDPAPRPPTPPAQ